MSQAQSTNPPFVHPSSIVEEGAVLEDGVKVWHFCHVMPGAHMGAGTSLGQNGFVASNVRIGANVKIQNNVSLYEGLTIEDDVFLGPSCVFTNVRNPEARSTAVANTKPPSSSEAPPLAPTPRSVVASPWENTAWWPPAPLSPKMSRPSRWWAACPPNTWDGCPIRENGLSRWTTLASRFVRNWSDQIDNHLHHGHSIP